MKGDIHSYVFSTSSFLCDIRKLRYRQNKIGYQIIKIVNNRLIPYSWNMMPCIVLLVSRPTNVTEKTACTQMKGGIPRYVFSTSSPLCDIGEPRYRQNNAEYQILWIGYCPKQWSPIALYTWQPLKKGTEESGEDENSSCTKILQPNRHGTSITETVNKDAEL